VCHPALALLGRDEVRLQVLDRGDEAGVRGRIHHGAAEQQVLVARVRVQERSEVRRDLDDGQRPREPGWEKYAT
jgi:hypothetical protein